jgi:predicted ATPase
MRIGIMGAQSVGKTTLLKELVGCPELLGHAFIPGLSRLAQKRTGVKLNQEANFDTQKELVKNMTYHVKLFENLVTDRTFLDIYAYTVYMHETGVLDSQQVNYIRQRVFKYQPLFDLVVYLRPEFPPVEDGVRSADPAYAIGIAACMERVVHNNGYLRANYLLEVSGATEARAEAVKAWVRRRDEARV